MSKPYSEWMEERKERARARVRAYRSAHREEANTRRRVYHSAHREEVRARMRAYYSTHREEARARARAYQSAYSEERIAKSKAYYSAHRDEAIARVKAWAKSHPESRAAIEHKRRSRIAGGGGSFTAIEWKNLKAKYGYRCPVCLRTEPDIKLTADHITPASQGGSSWIENIQPLCRSCNSKKHTKTWKAPCQEVEHD